MIRVRIYRCKDSVKRTRFRRVVMYCISDLMPKKRSLDIKITIVEGLNDVEKMSGSCLPDDTPNSHKHSKFIICVDADLGIEDAFSIIAHELTHVKQYALGELSYDYKNPDKNIWKGKIILEDSIPYEKQPWEKDATKNERRLMIKIKDHGY